MNANFKIVIVKNVMDSWTLTISYRSENLHSVSSSIHETRDKAVIQARNFVGLRILELGGIE